VSEGINFPVCGHRSLQNLVPVEKEKGEDKNADDDITDENYANNSKRDGDGLSVKPFCDALFEVVDAFYKALQVFCS
jgi:hypothetical protein